MCEVPYGSYPGNMPGEYYSDEAHLRAWLDAGEPLHAPLLLPYEVANALTRLLVAGRLAASDIAQD